jgi:hypothetical protein
VTTGSARSPESSAAIDSLSHAHAIPGRNRDPKVSTAHEMMVAQLHTCQ